MRVVIINAQIPGVRLGLVEATGARILPAPPELACELDAVSERLRRELTIEQVAELDAVSDVRTMFRSWGVDPARYRPSSEALLRRVVAGKGLYRVSNVVDINNLGSIETGWPYGSYDRARLEPPVTFRLGRRGETYEGIGKHTWHLEDRPVLADLLGPFGSPISDSVRTMITEVTSAVLMVIYAPAGSTARAIRQGLEQCALRLERFAGARIETTEVLNGSGWPAD
ncbi:MAG TPA: phenylalanine--tRNA ligase beta subunit-related protein [Candidatus Acidoferrales bacterium]|nr:phenylalanine--tRNA ligase beta subunit-related protein [Candidatus Acidoferrales bacterium]